MIASHAVELAAPRFEHGPERKIAGFGERYLYTAIENIPALWYRFGPHIGKVPGQIGVITYGVCSNGDDAGFDYLAGVEVATFLGLDERFRTILVPAAPYAVFSHSGHVSSLHQTFEAIWGKWLLDSGRRFAATPVFERYGEGFEPDSGSGGIEIWCPLAA